MKAITISQFGDTSVFEQTTINVPALKPGHVLIKVAATSVNPVDTKIRSGRYPAISPEFPAVLHCDVAGTIEAVNPDVTQFKVGDEVFGCAGGVKGQGGALAEFMLADARLITHKPSTLSMAEAAVLPLVTITAWEALFEKVKLTDKQTILVHAGTGGVGHVGIQLAKWAGAKVYATISSPEKAAIAKSLGADEVINYREESVADYVKRLTNGKGFDVVFDTIGGDNIDRSFEAVAHYGQVVCISSNSTHDLTPLHLKSATFHAVLMLLPMLLNQQRERHQSILKKTAELVMTHQLKPLVDPHQFSFSEAGKAHDLLESGKAIGKIAIAKPFN